MKNRLLSLIFALFLIPVIPSFSQERAIDEGDNSINIKKWLPSTIGFRIGGYEDHYQDLTLQGLQSMIGDQTELTDFLEDGYGQGYFTAISGTNLGIQFSLTPFSRRKGDYNPNHEWRFSLSTNTERESMLVYERSNPQYTYSVQDEIIFCLIENEVILETSYLFHWPVSKKFSLYGGMGINLGSTFGNELLVFGSEVQLLGEDMHQYEAANSSYFRVLVQSGMQYQVLKRLGMYLEFQGGGGMQIVHGGENNQLDNCATFFGINYNFVK